MKTRLMVVAALLLAIIIPASAKEDKRDGTWWLGAATRSEKMYYVIGLFDGVNAALVLNASDETEYARVQAAITVQLGNVTSDQMTAGLDAFYKDVKNRSILISDAMWIVSMQIRGMPEDQIVKGVEMLRQRQ